MALLLSPSPHNTSLARDTRAWGRLRNAPALQLSLFVGAQMKRGLGASSDHAAA